MKSQLKKAVALILTWEARLVLKKYKPKIVAVTGSVGKTTTKDAIYTVLSASFFVRKSEKSYNSEIGIPLTILGLHNAWSNPLGWAKNIIEGFALVLLKSNYPDWLVLEVGADRPGDIRSVAAWLRPDVVVITRIPQIPVHVEFFPTPEALAREKRYLAEALPPAGILILNADDERVANIAHPHKRAVLRYGFAEGAQVRGSHEHVAMRKGRPAGMTLKIHRGEEAFSVALEAALGRQQLYPLLAAATAGFALKMGAEAIREALAKHVPPPGRMHLIEGVRKSTIIDDTYNASPAAVEEALAALGSVESAGRKIAVLGDMLELGVYSATAHRNIGIFAADKAAVLLTVGVRAEYIAEGAEKAGMKKENIHRFSSAPDAVAPLLELLREGDIVLVKGSQSMRMERLVEALMVHPERREELLVRQDAYWRAKE